MVWNRINGCALVVKLKQWQQHLVARYLGHVLKLSDFNYATMVSLFTHRKLVHNCFSSVICCLKKFWSWETGYNRKSLASLLKVLFIDRMRSSLDLALRAVVFFLNSIFKLSEDCGLVEICCLESFEAYKILSKSKLLRFSTPSSKWCMLKFLIMSYRRQSACITICFNRLATNISWVLNLADRRASAINLAM